MMTLPSAAVRLSDQSVAEFVRDAGRWRVLRAVLALSLLPARAAPLPRASDLSDHLRRDLGLDPLPPSGLRPRPGLQHGRGVPW